VGDVNKQEDRENYIETPFTRILAHELSFKYGFNCKVVKVRSYKRSERDPWEFRVAGSDGKGNWCYGQDANPHIAGELMIRERDRWLNSGFTNLLGRGNLVLTKGTEGITDMKGKT